MPTLKNNISGLTLANQVQAARAVQKLDPTVKVRQTGITSFGAVAQSAGQSNGIGMPTSITLTFDNSAGVAAKDYKIGDADNWILATVGKTAVQADRSSGISGAALAKVFAQAPMTVLGLTYTSTSGAVQFSQPFTYITGEVDGTGLTKPVNMAEYQRNTAYDPNMLTLEFQNQFVLDWNTAFYISAGIGQLVNVTLLFGAASYR